MEVPKEMRLRLRFYKDIPQNIAVVRQKFEDFKAICSKDYSIKVNENHIWLHIVGENKQYYSPHLHVELEQNKENEIVTIPSFRGRAPKEVSIKNLAKVIQSRIEEIFEEVLFQIKSSGLEKKLNAGIVITGGGSQLKHLTMTVELVTGMDTRIGYANEHLGKSHIDEIKSPMYATAVGLVIKGFEGIDMSSEEASEELLDIKEVKEGKSIFKGLLKKYNNWMFSADDMKDF